jgi:hypothetical protein
MRKDYRPFPDGDLISEPIDTQAIAEFYSPIISPVIHFACVPRTRSNQREAQTHLNIMHVFLTSCFYLKHNVSETVFCLLLQVEPTDLGTIDRASPYPPHAGLEKSKLTQRAL